MRSSPSLRIVGGLLAAFGVAVAVETLITCGYAILRILASGRGLGETQGDGMMLVALAAAYVSVRMASVTMVLVALPYVIVSRKLKRISLRYYLFSGTAIGAGVFAVMILRRLTYPAPPLRMSGELVFLAISAIISGTSAALTYWMVARPDKDTPPRATK